MQKPKSFKKYETLESYNEEDAVKRRTHKDKPGVLN